MFDAKRATPLARIQKKFKRAKKKNKNNRPADVLAEAAREAGARVTAAAKVAGMKAEKGIEIAAERARDDLVPRIDAAVAAAKPALVAIAKALTEDRSNEKADEKVRRAKAKTKRTRERARTVRRGALLAGGVIGVAAAYLLDPDSGAQRRARLRELGSARHPETQRIAA